MSRPSHVKDIIMRTKISTLVIASALVSSFGCAFVARDTPTYESDTSQLLDTRADAWIGDRLGGRGRDVFARAAERTAEQHQRQQPRGRGPCDH